MHVEFSLRKSVCRVPHVFHISLPCAKLYILTNMHSNNGEFFLLAERSIRVHFISTIARATCNNVIVEVFDEWLYYDSRQWIALGCITMHCYFNLLYYNIHCLAKVFGPP